MTAKTKARTKRTKKQPTRPTTKSKVDAAKLPARVRKNVETRDSALSQTTKTGRCIELLTRRNGATIEELMTATGWQAHSIRGFLSGTVKKKLGHKLDSAISATGARRYRIIHPKEEI